MKTKNVLTLLIMSVAFLFISCSDDDNKGSGAKNTDNQSINTWIYDEMEYNYFWYSNLPSKSALDFNLEPNEFFYKLLYRTPVESDGDRFSTLENNGVPYYETSSADGTIKHNEIGFEFQAYTKTNASYDVELCVTYVKKDSEAEKQGLKRGDWIVKVNNTPINKDNFYSILYTGKPSFNLQFKNRDALTLNATSVHYESPVLHSDILLEGGKRIGYIVYNFFANGRQETSYEYALEMNEVLNSFQGNIDELILDLRYNGGGYVSSGTYIASALAPSRTGKIYTKRNYNDKLEKLSSYQRQKTNPFVEKIAGTTIPKLEMKKLYVITSNRTASASEQIINGLDPYMDVVIIGETTRGKNMESFAIKDNTNKKNKWILHALTSISYRSDVDNPKDNNYSKGFEPTSKKNISEFTFYDNDTSDPLLPLGNKNEKLLAVTLQHITGKQKRITYSTQNAVERQALGASIDRKNNAMIVEIE